MNSKTIALVLRTLKLKGGIAPAEAQRLWAGSDTTGLIALMASEGAGLWLYRRLRALEVTEPEAFLVKLRTEAQRVAVYALRVDAQTAAVTDVLRDAGLPFALIKGQARRAAADRYPYADARGVVDVDLLLPESRAPDAWELLRQRGYEPCYPEPTTWIVTHHLPALWDEKRVSVELHVTTADAVAPEEAWRRAAQGSDPVTWNKVQMSVPCATELVWQALAHAIEDGPKGCRLSAFLNVAVVLAQDPPILWERVRDRIAAGEIRDQDFERPVSASQVLRWLAAAAEFAGGALPPELGSVDRLDLERLLLWRGKVLSSRLGGSVKDRLLEEGDRFESQMPLSPAVSGTAMVLRARRRSASVAARILYAVWRAGH